MSLNNQHAAQVLKLHQEIKFKDLQIVQLKDQLELKEQQCVQARQQLQSVQLYLKQRTHALNHKNVQIAQHEHQVTTLLQQNKEISKLIEHNNHLQMIITEQQQQLQSMLHDSEAYVRHLQGVHEISDGYLQYQQLMIAYRNELQQQINQVEDINEVLLTVQQQTQQELHLQNEQSNDLLDQVENMVTVIKS